MIEHLAGERLVEREPSSDLDVELGCCGVCLLRHDSSCGVGGKLCGSRGIVHGGAQGVLETCTQPLWHNRDCELRQVGKVTEYLQMWLDWYQQRNSLRGDV